jgi:beta-glucanase (GH16 family)
MWDEFNGPELDARKWWPKNPVWRGRPPVFFHPKNVAVRDGKLLLTANKKETGEGFKELPKGYTHTSGYVKSKAPLLYGYVEMRAKVLNASMTSGFWLYDNTPEAWTEIDIVEMAAGLPDRDRKDTMNVHVFRVPGFKGSIEHHWVSGGTWTAPFRFADDYHVYGLEWDRDRIAWYVDGVMVRRIKNTHWRYPLYLNINIESQQTFLDNPMEERYPATYDVDCVRAWSAKP